MSLASINKCFTIEQREKEMRLSANYDNPSNALPQRSSRDCSKWTGSSFVLGPRAVLTS